MAVSAATRACVEQLGRRPHLQARTAKQATAVGQSGIRARVLRVKRRRLLEHRDALAYGGLGRLLAIGTALERSFVGGKVRRSAGRARHERREHAAQRLRDAPGYVTLQHQHVVEAPLVRLRPQPRLALHIRNVAVSANSGRIAVDTAFKQVVDAKFLPDLHHALARRFVLHRRRAGNHAEALWVQRAELRDHLVGHAIAEELVVGVAAAILERQDHEASSAQPRSARHSRSRDSQAPAIAASTATAARASGSPAVEWSIARDLSQSRRPPARGRWCLSPPAPFHASRVTPGRGWPGRSRCASRCCAGAGSATAPTTRTCPRDRG